MAGAGRSVTCFEPRGVRTEIVGSARAQWHLGCVRQKTLAMPILSGRCQKSLAVPELGGAIADVDIEAEISRARTYSMELPAAVAAGILILGDATSTIKLAGMLLIMLGIYASESKRISEEEDQAEPSSRAMTNDTVRASSELFRLGQSTMLR